MGFAARHLDSEHMHNSVASTPDCKGHRMDGFQHGPKKATLSKRENSTYGPMRSLDFHVLI